MKTALIKVIQYVLFLFLGGFIIWWLYRDQNLEELLMAIRKDVNYFWIFMMLLIAFLSNVSRVIRWQIMIRTIHCWPGFINTFLALMIGYLANLVVPRMGEVTRCAVLSKHEGISFTRLVGTVVAERLMDIIILLVSTVLVVILETRLILSLLTGTFDFSSTVVSPGVHFLYIVLFLFLLAIWQFRKKIKESRYFYRVQGLWIKFKEGFLSINKIILNPWFIIHSGLIFFFYFLMMYVSFLAFPYTDHLTITAGLTLFVFGSMGMVAPVQGGVGTWHFMVITALTAYGIPVAHAALFALVVHGALNIMIIICGLIAMFILPFLNFPKNEAVK